MKRLYRASTVILLAATGLGLGVVGVRATTECERFIRVVVNPKPKHHKISSETAARWAAWNKAHPNYHPRKLTPKETWQKVNFACQVPVIEETAALDFPSLEAPPLELPPDLFQPELPNVVLPAFPETLPTEALLVPPAYAPEVPTLFGPTFPAAPPTLTPPPSLPAPTPEPGSLWLMATAMFSLLVLALRRRTKALRA